jgi:hypothetical protein
MIIKYYDVEESSPQVEVVVALCGRNRTVRIGVGQLRERCDAVVSLRASCDLQRSATAAAGLRAKPSNRLSDKASLPSRYQPALSHAITSIDSWTRRRSDSCRTGSLGGASAMGWIGMALSSSGGASAHACRMARCGGSTGGRASSLSGDGCSGASLSRH